MSDPLQSPGLASPGSISATTPQDAPVDATHLDSTPGSSAGGALGIERWRPGEVLLGLYEVLGVAGEGGMGTVYRVRHRGWGIDLAVKCPRPEMVAAGAEAFEREAETWVGLGLHPHVASCYYVRRINGLPRVFAEFVEGGSLADWIQDGRLHAGGPAESARRILDIAIQFAWGLQHAHEHQVVHQDVKPHNVLLTAHGTAKVTDFGLARARPAGLPVGTRAGHSILVSAGGLTPAYCSPEQAAGQPLSRKTDVWSWAVSLLEMFTGEITWMGGPVAGEALEHYLTQPPEGMELPIMPARVQQLLRRCFLPSPEERPRDMHEVAGELQTAYRELSGANYPRHLPRAGTAVADALNNRAVSLLDLGKEAEAERTWQEAVRAEVMHPEANYNLGLLQWRKGRLTDEEVVRQMTAVCGAYPGRWLPTYLLACIHLERGDNEKAVELLRSLSEEDSRREEVRSARARAVQRLVSQTPLSRWSLGPGIDAAHLAIEGNEGVCVFTARHEKQYESAREKAFPQPRLIVSGGEEEVRSISYSCAVRRWNLATGQLLPEKGGACEGIPLRGLCLEGRYALVHKRLQIKIWDMVTNKVLAEFPLHELPSQSQWLLCLQRALRAEALLAQHQDKDPGPYQGYGDRVAPFVALGGEGRIALHGSSLGKLTVLDASSGRPLRTLTGHRDPAIVGAIDLRERYAATGGLDNALRLWELSTGRCLRTFLWQEGLSAVALSPDARFALAASADGGLKIWYTGAEEGPWTAPVMLSGVVASESVLEFEGSLKEARSAFARSDYATAAKHLRQARELPGCSRGPEILKDWQNLYSHLRHRAFRGVWEERVFQAQGGIKSLALSQNGRLALVGGNGALPTVWNVEAGQVFRTLPHAGMTVNAVALSADGRKAATGTGDRKIEVWDVETGKRLGQFRGHGAWVSSLCLDASGVSLLSGSGDGTLRLWDVGSGRLRRSFQASKDEEVRSVALSADGELVCGGTVKGLICVWRANGKWVRRFQAHEGPVHTLSLSSDGQSLLSGGEDRCVRHWSVADVAVRTLSGHAGAIASVCHSADGRFALSASGDRTVRLWDLTSGDCLHTFSGHTAAVGAVGVSPDGRFALSADLNGSLRQWLLDWELEGGRNETEKVKSDSEALLELPLTRLIVKDGQLRQGTASGGIRQEYPLTEVTRVALRNKWVRPTANWLYTLMLGIASLAFVVPVGLRFSPELRDLIGWDRTAYWPLIGSLVLLNFLFVYLIMTVGVWIFYSRLQLVLEVRLQGESVHIPLDDSTKRCRAFVQNLDGLLRQCDRNKVEEES